MRSTKILALPALALALLSMTACGTPVRETVETRGQYWQRVSASSALYMQGPKAQEMLNRDLARCVNEVSELVRLGQVKASVPGNPEKFRPGSAQAKLSEWDTPDRDGVLLIENKEFNDFDSCMYVSGWERVKYVPYDVVKTSRDAYMQNNVNFQKLYMRNGNVVAEENQQNYGKLND